MEDLLKEVADQQAKVTVRLADGREIVMGPKVILEPLPELEGEVPDNWKDALYARE